MPTFYVDDFVDKKVLGVQKGNAFVKFSDKQ